ncbi:hypothetical protein BC830DRAFT_1110837 [Chytriomyces sp. MP71]|nr:hypothetical protein BC830DRAFT_1110837 [Chytriomyces sp. MP71]
MVSSSSTPSSRDSLVPATFLPSLTPPQTSQSLPHILELERKIHELESAATMPNMGDWVLYHQYVEQGLGDKDCLAAFFSLSPALRATLCLMAASALRPRLPDFVCIGYFTAARNLLLRSWDTPSIKTLDAMRRLTLFVVNLGQSLASSRLWRRVLEFTFALGVHIDPDDSPLTCDLSDKEKNERRTLFSRIYHWYRFLEVGYATSFSYRFLPGAVKPVPYRDPQELLIHATDVNILFILNPLLDIIIAAARHHYAIPSSVHEIQCSTEVQSLQLQLQLFLANTSPSIILTQTDLVSLHHFLTTFPSAIAAAEILTTTMNYHAARTLITRAQLHLTAHLPLSHPLLFNNPTALTRLLSVLANTLASARTIVRLASHVSQLGGTEGSNSPLRAGFMQSISMTSFSMFEGVVCLWFLCCRTRAFWWHANPTPAIGGSDGPLTMGISQRLEIRECCLDVLRLFVENDAAAVQEKEEGVSYPTFFDREASKTQMQSRVLTPMIECMRAMVAEMAEFEALVASGVNPAPALASQMLDSVVLKLEVLVVDEGLGNSNTDSSELVARDGAWSYLGLLGEVVKGGVVWNQHYEKGWREFWASVE